MLSDIDLTVRPGEPSPSSAPPVPARARCCTCSAGLDKPSAGEVTLMGQAFSALNEVQRGDWRNRHLGLFTSFTICCPEFSALGNVAMPLLIRRTERQAALARAAEILAAVGLGASP